MPDYAFYDIVNDSYSLNLWIRFLEMRENFFRKLVDKVKRIARRKE